MSNDAMFGNEARANQYRLRAAMRKIIAERKQVAEPKPQGECGGCGWKCNVNDRTCVIDYDEMRVDYQTPSGEWEEDWEWVHWCITHEKGRRVE